MFKETRSRLLITGEKRNYENTLGEQVDTKLINYLLTPLNNFNMKNVNHLFEGSYRKLPDYK
jgi:hypothetical protein